MLAILHVSAFDLFGRLVALGHLYAVADPAHVDLGRRGALAGMEAFGVENDVELVVEFDDIALAKRAGDDFHGGFPSIVPAAATEAGAAQMSGRTILILRPFASDFRSFYSAQTAG